MISSFLELIINLLLHFFFLGGGGGGGSIFMSSLWMALILWAACVCMRERESM